MVGGRIRGGRSASARGDALSTQISHCTDWGSKIPHRYGRGARGGGDGIKKDPGCKNREAIKEKGVNRGGQKATPV